MGMPNKSEWLCNSDTEEIWSYMRDVHGIDPPVDFFYDQIAKYIDDDMIKRYPDLKPILKDLTRKAVK